MEDSNKCGVYHRNTLKVSHTPYTVMESLPIQYLRTSEICTWIELNRLANMTTFDRGEFVVTLKQLENTTGLKKRWLIDVLDKLRTIGFLSSCRIGKMNKYRINYDTTSIISKILMKNPGIGEALRKVCGDEHNAAFTSNDQVARACKMTGVEFKWCDFLKK